MALTSHKSGLLSAAIAAFLGQSYITSIQPPTPPDDSVPPPGTDDSSEAKLFNTDVAWFLGLGTSLCSAVLATLLQSWVNRYVLMTQAVQNPRACALIRAHVILEKTLLSLQLTFDFLHLLLDFAIFAFLFGLIYLLPTNKSKSSINLGPQTSNFSIIFITFPLFAWYLVLSLISVRRHTIYSTPLSRVIRHIIQDIKLMLWGSISAFRSSQDNAFLDFDWITLNHVDRVPEKLIKTHRTHPLSLDQEVLTWLLSSLHHDLDFERFLQSIPGFYHSNVVKEPAEIFHPLCEDEVPRAILSFMQRTLSSPTLSNEIKQNRVRLFFDVMGQDSYLLERTFFHILSLPAKPIIFQCVDLVLAGDANGNPDAQFLAKCIVTVAISRITTQELDERWAPVVERLSNFPLSDATLGEQLASMKLLNLVRLAEELKSAGLRSKNNVPHRFLRTAGNFQVEGVSPESRNEFCNLWNQLRDSAASTWYPGSNASLILREICTIYDTLHESTNNTPINPDLRPANYPRCTIHTHPHDPHSTPGVSTNIASASGEVPPDTATQLLSPATSRSTSP